MDKDNKLQLNFSVEPSLSFSYSTSGDKVLSINNPAIYVNIKIGKHSAGYCNVDFKSLISEHTKINKKNKFDKELTIQVYEKMIAELAEQINNLKE
jgi:hypothetical protein